MNPAFLFWEVFILFSSTAFQKHWKKLLVGHNLCSFQNIRACWVWVKNRENFFLCHTSLCQYISSAVLTACSFKCEIYIASLKIETDGPLRMDQTELMCWSAVHCDCNTLIHQEPICLISDFNIFFFPLLMDYVF